MAFLGGHVLREARLRAGLTQTELAARIGTTQSAVARWERAAGDLGVDKLQEAVTACGYSLNVQLEPRDDSDLVQAARLERIPIEDRIAWHNDARRLVSKLQEAGRNATRA